MILQKNILLCYQGKQKALSLKHYCHPAHIITRHLAHII